MTPLFLAAMSLLIALAAVASAATFLVYFAFQSSPMTGLITLCLISLLLKYLYSLLDMAEGES